MKRMYEIPSINRVVVLVSICGEKSEYHSYHQLISTATDYIYRSIGNSYDEVMKTPTGRPGGYIYWIAHWDNEHGDLIDALKIRSDIYSYKYSKYKGVYHWIYRLYGFYIYRYDSVPNIHKKRWHRASYYRHFRTTQEKRKYFDAVENGVIVRGSRRPHLLPSS